jgi:hypothetical protein
MYAFRHFAAPAAALCIAAGVVGCSSDPKPEQVPASAQMRVQGDQDLAYTAPSDGEVYVYDASARKLLYSGHVERGQNVTIDPDEDKIMIDGKLALEKDIHAGNRHRIYFTPDAHDVDRVVEHRTEIHEERPAGARIDSDATIHREETKHVDVDRDGDTTVKKETTIKTD